MRIMAGGKALEGHWFGPRSQFGSQFGSQNGLQNGSRDGPHNGQGDRPAIVLLHEGLGSLSLWRDFPQRLANASKCGVFAWSRAGYGNSEAVDLPRPIDYMSIEAARVLPEVLNQIGFKRGLLLGHSDGASIAAIHAGTIDDPRVRGLCLVAPHFFAEPISIESITQARQAYEHGDLREKLARHHQNVDVAFYGWNRAWLDPEFMAWNIEHAIDGIEVPVLAIQGALDQYGTLAQIEALKTRLQPELKIAILAGCRHAPHQEQPEKVLQLLVDFLGDC